MDFKLEQVNNGFILSFGKKRVVFYHLKDVKKIVSSLIDDNFNEPDGLKPTKNKL